MNKTIIPLILIAVLSISLISCGSVKNTLTENTSSSSIETPPNVGSNKLSKVRQKN
jgi:hypothetical protein